MNNAFNQSLIDYPLWSFIWEIIKVLLPTMVAIGAIVVNNNRAKKRDYENKKKDILLKWRLDLLNYITDLSNLADEVSRSYIDIMDADSLETAKACEKTFKRKHFEMMALALKIMRYSKSLNSGMDMRVDLSDIGKISERYVLSLLEIKQKYRKTIEIRTDRNNELDDVNDNISKFNSCIEEKIKRISEEIVGLINN